MIRRALAAVALLTIAVPLHAGFNEVARAVQSKRGVKRVWIPFLGIARAAIWMARPAGVHDFQLATFEGTDDVDPRELANVLRERAGEGYQPLVQVRSARSGEWSFIYAKPSPGGSRIDLLILTHDHDETVLVRVDVNADELVRQMNDPRGVVRIAGD
jgi:hypothetical protein